MSEREDITINGRVTSIHLSELTGADLVRFSPATHRGACLHIPDVSAGMAFNYDGKTFEIIKAWDEAALATPEPGARHARRNMSSEDAAYYASRKGKFIDLLAKVQG